MVESVFESEYTYKAAVLIPVYNHEESIVTTLNKVLAYEYPVLLVDDGSDSTCQKVLVDLASRNNMRVTLLQLKQNCGKGAAIKAGLSALMASKFSHAIQVDADGQHDLRDLSKLVEASMQYPEALVTTYPVYDESVPVVRYYCRYLTHIWVWINTLSFKIRDSMCGFRVYPVTSIVTLLEEEKCGDRMEFDPEIIVRWSWRGNNIMNLSTKVRYPADGVSHFHYLRDNWLISMMHTRLFFGMLLRLPRIVWSRLNG